MGEGKGNKQFVYTSEVNNSEHFDFRVEYKLFLTSSVLCYMDRISMPKAQKSVFHSYKSFLFNR